MAQFLRGDLLQSDWDKSPDSNYLLFSANSVINSQGALVMGRGFALAVRNKYPGVDADIGKSIGRRGYSLYQNNYGIAFGKRYWDHVGAFQVKHHWKRPARYDLIKQSTYKLMDFCAANPDSEIHMNYPGIGLGGLNADKVANIISNLPDQVVVWRLY